MPETTDQATDLMDVPVPAHIGKREGSFINRLSTGTGAFDILGKRRYYYWFSTALVVLSVLFIIVRGFNFGIDFAGGTRLTFQPADGVKSVSTSEVARVVSEASGASDPLVQTVGSQIQVTISELPVDKVDAAKQAVANSFHASNVSATDVSGTWGQEISQRAIIAVIVFLVLVGLFIWIRYERRVALGAVGSTLHDLVVTAGIYAAVGFEVTPATVIGLLTIMGFSLYDTVVVYDKVQENTKGLTSMNRRTYQEAANLAVNQTLMRSINTSLIALLPVAGLLVAGVAILGSGTLKDLALVLLVGMLVGAYSSVFLAVPIAVDLKNREPSIKVHTARVQAKRKQEGLVVDADGDPISRAGVAVADRPTVADTPGVHAAVAPRPGQKPVRSKPAVAQPPASAPASSPSRKGARPTGKRGRG